MNKNQNMDRITDRSYRRYICYRPVGELWVLVMGAPKGYYLIFRFVFTNWNRQIGYRMGHCPNYLAKNNQKRND